MLLIEGHLALGILQRSGLRLWRTLMGPTFRLYHIVSLIRGQGVGHLTVSLAGLWSHPCAMLVVLVLVDGLLRGLLILFLWG